MTLLMGALANNTAFNISDRLLTQKLAVGDKYVGIRTFDDASNKTIVYACSNGMIAISFTGTAYIDDITTDRWIAEILTGITLPEESSFKFIENPKKLKDVGLAVQTIIDELNKIWSTLGREQRDANIGFLITGWQNIKSKWKSICWGLEGNGTDVDPFKLRAFRNIQTKREIRLETSGVTVTKEEMTTIIEQVYEEKLHGTAKSAQNKLVEGLRDIAQNHSTVGTDCLSVKLTWQSQPFITIEYFPDPNKAVPTRALNTPIGNRNGMFIGVGNLDEIPMNPPDIESMGAYFCPWIITNQYIVPPSSVVGTHTIKSGDLDLVKIIGSESPANMIGALLAQARPTKS